MMIAGETPKAITSDSESSSAPNRLSPLSKRATRPSSPSSAAATKIASTARSHSPEMPKRTALKPEHSANAVIALGASARSGIPRGRRAMLLRHAGYRGGVADDAEDRLAGEGALAKRNLRRGAIRQIDVD